MLLTTDVKRALAKLGRACLANRVRNINFAPKPLSFDHQEPPFRVGTLRVESLVQDASIGLMTYKPSWIDRWMPVGRPRRFRSNAINLHLQPSLDTISGALIAGLRSAWSGHDVGIYRV